MQRKFCETSAGLRRQCFIKSPDFSVDHAILLQELMKRIIEEQLNLSHSTVQSVLTNAVGMRKVCSKMAPKHDIRTERGIDFLESIVPEGQTLNQYVYLQVLVRSKIGVVLRQYNTPCHTAVSTNELLDSKNIHAVLQPPYSPV